MNRNQTTRLQVTLPDGDVTGRSSLSLRFPSFFVHFSSVKCQKLRFDPLWIAPSAQTSVHTDTEAEVLDDLLDGPKEFAAAFGPQSAYVGWAWTIGPKAAQTFTSKFLSHLTGGVTVEDALTNFRQENFQQRASKYLKIHGKKLNVVDLTANVQ